MDLKIFKSKKINFIIITFLVLVIIFIYDVFENRALILNGKNSNTFDSLTNEIGRKYVLLSANIETNNNYMFNIPMVCLSWRRLNYEPIVLIVYSDLSNINVLTNKTIEYLDLFNIKKILIKSPNQYDLLIGMLSRLFAGSLPDSLISKNDFIITSDSDLYPISSTYFNIENSDSIVVWNGFCCGTFKYENKNYEVYPISSIGMKKWQWQQVMKVNSTKVELDGNYILKSISNESNFVQKNDKIIKGGASWFIDQTLISMNIRKYLDEHENSNLNKIRYSGTRLDRSMSKKIWLFNLNFKFDSITDCHSFQSNVFDNWNLLQELFLRLFSQKICSILDKYFHEYVYLKDNILILKK